jgi:hypothetical protein
MFSQRAQRHRDGSRTMRRIRGFGAVGRGAGGDVGVGILGLSRRVVAR